METKNAAGGLNKPKGRAIIFLATDNDKATYQHCANLARGE
jgi:hypothetical protein